MKGKPIGTTTVLGMLFGVVLSSMTGEWWWIGIGFAVGLAIEAGLHHRAKKSRSPASDDRPGQP